LHYKSSFSRKTIQVLYETVDRELNFAVNNLMSKEKVQLWPFSACANRNKKIRQTADAKTCPMHLLQLHVKRKLVMQDFAIEVVE